MYFLSEDPKHKLLEKIRTWGGYFVFLLLTGVIGTLIILYYSGYSFTKDGGVSRKGFVTVTSSPVKAEVYLDGKKLKGETYMKLDVPIGEHNFVARAKGYREWSRSLNIEPSGVYWLDYIRLYPKTINSYAQQTMSKYKLIQEINKKDRLLLVDWDQANLHINTLNLKNKSSSNIKNYPFTTSKLGLDVEETIEGVEQFNLNYHQEVALIKLKTSSGYRWLYYNFDKPEEIINVSKEFGLNTDTFQFTYDKKNQIAYVDENQNLRIIDLDSKIITKPLLNQKDVTTWAIKSKDEIYFVAGNKLMLKNYDKDAADEVGDLADLSNRQLKLNPYDSNLYFIDYGQQQNGSVFNVWQLDGGQLVNRYSKQMNGTINNFQSSNNNRTVLVSTDQSEVATFVLNDRIGGDFKLKDGAANIKWGGVFQIAYTNGNAYHLVDFTGDNDNYIADVNPAYPITIDSDFENIFFISDTPDNQDTLHLNTIDMVVDN